MANSRAAIVVVFLLVLASAQNTVHARMMPSDHLQGVVHARPRETGAASSSPASQYLGQQVLTTVPSALTRELSISAGERRQMNQDDGSVPSPGVGHH